MANNNLTDIVNAVGDLPGTIQDVQSQLAMAKAQAIVSIGLLLYIALKVSK